MGFCNILDDPGAAFLDCRSQLVVCNVGEIELARLCSGLTGLDTEDMIRVVYGIKMHEIRECTKEWKRKFV